MFFELRQHELHPDKLDEWVQLMEMVIIPYQMSKGMVIVGSFVDEESNKCIWMRRFESEADREQLYEAVYQTDYWQNEIRPQIRAITASITVTQVKTNPHSVIR